AVELVPQEPSAAPSNTRRAPKRKSKRVSKVGGRTPKLEVVIPDAEAAENADLLDALIQPAALNAYDSGDVVAAEESLQQLDDDRLLEQHVAFAVAGAWRHAFSGRPTQAERWFHAAERAADGYDGDLLDGSHSAAAWLALLRAGLCREGPEQMHA